MPHPGDVLLIPFPCTDLTTTKRRPVLVPGHADFFGDILADAITSQPGHEDALPLCQGDFQEGNLPKPGYLRTTKLYTLNRRIAASRFGRLTPSAFQREHGTICAVLGCE